MTVHDAPIITVIIPVWNGADRIEQTLAALETQSTPTDRYEVIVVDNGSTDDTVERVRQHPIATLLLEPQPGSYRARNKAISAARGSWLLFTDADCVPDVDWIAQALAATARYPEAGVIGGRIQLFREEGCGEVAFQYEQMMAFDQSRNIAEGRCVTANWLSPKRAIEEAGLFDADLLSGGDVAMSNRIAAAGLPMHYSPAMVVGHPSRASLGELISKRRRTLGGRYMLQNMRFGPYWVRKLSSETFANMRRVGKLPLRTSTKAGLSLYFLVLLLIALAELAALTVGKPPFRS